MRVIRSCSRSRCHATVASSVSSCGRARQPSSRCAFVDRYVQLWPCRAHLGRRQRPRAAAAPSTAAAAAAARGGSAPAGHSREPAEVGEQPVEGEVASAEAGSARPPSRPLGEQVAGRRVAHVDDRRPRRPCRPGCARAGSCARAAWRTAGGRPRRSTGRVHAHERQPLAGQAHRLGLRLVHGVHVRDAEPRGRERAASRRPPCPRPPGPTAAALDVYTTRSTPARRHSSITILVPPTFTSNRRSASSAAPRSRPRSGRPVDALERAAHRHGGRAPRASRARQSRSAMAVSGERSAPRAQLVAALGEEPGDV